MFATFTCSTKYGAALTRVTNVLKEHEILLKDQMIINKKLNNVECSSDKKP